MTDDPDRPADPVRKARDWLISQTGHEPTDPMDPPPSRNAGAPSSSEDPAQSKSWQFADAPAARVSDPTRGSSPAPGAGPGSRNTDPDADPASVARSVLVRKLAAQDRTRHELASALAAKNVPGEVAEQVLDRFAEIGLVDDESFARRWVESRQGRRHRSRTMLRRELAGKGVARDVVDEALAGVSAEDEVTAATAYVGKVARGMSSLDPAVRRRRLADRLARRGFGPEIIRRVLKDMDDEGI